MELILEKIDTNAVRNTYQDEKVLDTMDVLAAAGFRETRWVLHSLHRGQIDGASYGAGRACACLFGSLAKARGLDPLDAREGTRGRGADDFVRLLGLNVRAPGLDFRPSESLFSPIRPGDTPANRYHARLADTYISELLMSNPDWE